MRGNRQDLRMQRRVIDTVYIDAMVLADEARSYFDEGGRADREALDPIARVAFSCESLKVTTRLMHVIAWLLTQRAVAAGEISRALAATPARRLGDAPASDEALLPLLPENARALVEASRDLFARVQRIDERAAKLEPAPSPARSLLSRLERSL